MIIPYLPGNPKNSFSRYESCQYPMTPTSVCYHCGRQITEHFCISNNRELIDACADAIDTLDSIGVFATGPIKTAIDDTLKRCRVAIECAEGKKP